MTNEQSVPTGRVLHSWKEIASYTGRGVRTIQRYESQLGFPVRRPSGSPRSAVLAFSQEIDAWLAKSPTKSDRDLKANTDTAHKAAIPVYLLYDKAKIGQERAEAMQRRMEQMQTLVIQIRTRVQQSKERRDEIRSHTVTLAQLSKEKRISGGGGTFSHLLEPVSAT